MKPSGSGSRPSSPAAAAKKNSRPSSPSKSNPSRPGSPKRPDIPKVTFSVQDHKYDTDFVLSARGKLVEADNPPPPRIPFAEDEVNIENAPFRMTKTKIAVGPQANFKIPDSSIAQAHWKMVFQSIDLDKNGYVDRNEIQHCLAQLGQVAHRRDLDVMIMMTDPRFSDRLSIEDFVSFWKEPSSKFRNVVLSELPDSIQNMGDEQLTLAVVEEEEESSEEEESDLDLEGLGDEEVQALEDKKYNIKTSKRIQLADETGLTPSQIRKYFAKFNEMDRDGSGELSFEEFCNVMRDAGEGEWDKDDDEVKQCFRLFDVDGSGEINCKEFIMGLQMFSNQTPAQKMKFAFQIYDEDNSGNIEYDEMYKMVRSSLNAQGNTRESDITARCQEIYNALGIRFKGDVNFDQFMSLAKDNAHLIAPTENVSTKLLMGLMKKKETKLNPFKPHKRL